MSHAHSARSVLSNQHLALVLVDAELTAWLVSPVEPPQPLPLQGQMRLPIRRPQSLLPAWMDVMERLQDDGIYPAQIHWLLDAAARQVWMQATSDAGWADTPHWQLIAWEWLAGRFGLHEDRLQMSVEQLKHEVLPWLISQDSSAERQQLQDALTREHQDASTRLAAERAHLQRENERLRAQNLAVQQVDAERLVCFLPALYPRVFTQLGAVDLALLCGRVEPLSIPNPYPEPSEEALRILQKRFRDLPRELQRQIIHFVAHLPQRQKLTPRPEMRALINEFEES